MRLPRPFPSLLALGSEGKGSFAWNKGEKVFISRDFGNLREPENYFRYKKGIENLIEKEDFTAILVDLHPLYLSTRLGEELSQRFSIPLIKIQHHQAHIAGGMLEKGWRECIGVALDGTGYGEDRKIWGSEIFMVKEGNFERKYHLRYIPLPGGDKVVEEIWRIGVSLLLETYGEEAFNHFPHFWRHLPEEKAKTVVEMWRKNFHTPLSSGMGRLFDGFASLMGLKFCTLHPAEAPLFLEKLATSYKSVQMRPWEVRVVGEELDWRIWVKGLEEDILSGKDKQFLAYKFHLTLITAVEILVERLIEECNLKKIVLSGGVFLNALLRERLKENFSQKGFEVIVPEPPHDYSIPLGQIYVYYLKRTSSIE
ncbi:MAG TPA: hypothetical protein ENG13_01470 [bacterium]|nr:hypothetical protein [bacterium]HEX67720.1 hypothetical protein [bacterium]